MELRVPPHADYASVVACVVADAASRAQLEEERAGALRDAAAEAFSLIARIAMAGEREPLRVLARWTPAELCVSLIERGEPIDDSQARRDPQWQAVLDRVDRAQWKFHARTGTELQLAVQRPHGLGAANSALPVEDRSLPAPPQTYSIRRFTAADAPGVARAFYLTWGYHYIFPAVYVPERLIELNANDAYISMVAVAENGEVVGHYALQPVPGAPIADACAAIVVPAHRGRGLLDRLRAAAEEEAMRLGFAAYYSEPVTTHGRTQSESAKFGAKLCAIVLGGDPRSFVPKKMSVTGAAQRQSFTVFFKPLVQREKRPVYAPPRHREMIAKIYAQLGIEIDMRDGEPASGNGDLHVEVVRAEGYATIDVAAAGPATGDQLAQAVADLRHIARLGAVYVNLPLDEPATPELCETVERLGFYFCGVVPWAMHGRDVLRMQQPLTRIDLTGVTVIGDFGEELKVYIGQQMRTPRQTTA